MKVKKNMDKSRADNYLRSFTVEESGKWSTMEREMGRVDLFFNMEAISAYLHGYGNTQ